MIYPSAAESVVVQGGVVGARMRFRVGVLGIFLMLSPFSTLCQSLTSVHGHVFHADGFAPCNDALVQAWPCGAFFAVDDAGRFDATCPTGIDSLTVLAHGHRMATVVVDGKAHIDVALNSLAVDLSHAVVQGGSSEDAPEGVEVTAAADLMTALDRTAGLRSLDLGAGLIQPVVRGLVGARVAVLEDGVPQAGGRWGTDHGILLDPALSDGVEWVPGGGHIWSGPAAMGGALKLSPIRMMAESGNRTQAAMDFRWGDGRAKVHALHRVKNDKGQWHLGLSVARFGDRNVPQASFEYIGRQFVLTESRLPNTGGQSLHGVAGWRWTPSQQDVASFDVRWSSVRQGLFPGIIGIPDQGDLMGDGRPYTVALPNQHARRLQMAGKWGHSGRLDRTIRMSFSVNERLESAPPHAHGFGPAPDSDLSLRLGEVQGFFEGRWEGIHGAFGVQAEWLEAHTQGWEFLLPDHRRNRISAMAELKWSDRRLGLRLDGIHVAQTGHVEPLYAADGSVAGEDLRAAAMERVMPGWALTWYQPLPLGEEVEGSWTLAAYSRAPSSYALGANGIHHGTFRFEQGNAALNPEHTLEFRVSGRSAPKPPEATAGFDWNAQAFAAVHKGFIHLTPTAQFAPIAHAGQIYAFEARDAFRTGAELGLSWTKGRVRWSNSATLLGQWVLETGLGLPFTPPMDFQSEFRWAWGKSGTLALRHRAIAPATLTARNEMTTPGASLWGMELGVRGQRMALTLEADNLLNQAWLDHASAYRVLGLVAQGRWASLRFTLDVFRADATEYQTQ